MAPTMKKLLVLLLLMFCIFPVSAQDWSQSGDTIYGAYPGDCAGQVVSLNQNGTILAMSSPGSDAKGTSSGVVDVFQRSDGKLLRMGNTILGTSGYNYFGSAMELSNDGHTLLAGSATAHDPSGRWYGSIQAFGWDGSNWIQKGKALWGDSDGSYFGFSLGMSGDGNTVASVSPYDSNKIKVYQWDGSAWQQKGSTIPGEKTDGITDGAIDLSSDGNTVILGLPNSPSGKAKVFTWNGSTWTQKGSNLVGEAAGDRFGHNVKINANGNTILIGAPLNDANGPNTGRINVYDWDGTAWVQRGPSFFGTAQTTVDCCLANFAISLAESGNTVAYWSIANSTYDTSFVRVFDWDGTQWKQKGRTLIGGLGSNNEVNFIDLSADCSTIAIGFPYDFSFRDGFDAGRSIVYKWDLSASTNSLGQKDVHVYPNPFKDVFYVHSNQPVDWIGIYDVDGKVVFERFLFTDEKIELGNLAKGLYFIRMMTPEGLTTRKIMKR